MIHNNFIRMVFFVHWLENLWNFCISVIHLVCCFSFRFLFLGFHSVFSVEFKMLIEFLGVEILEFLGLSLTLQKLLIFSEHTLAFFSRPIFQYSSCSCKISIIERLFWFPFYRKKLIVPTWTVHRVLADPL